MSKNISEDSISSAPRPLSAAVEEYIATQTDEHIAILSDAKVQVAKTATRAFLRAEGVDTGVFMPVSKQEQLYIKRSLGQYAAARRPPVHRIIAYLNYPRTASRSEVVAMRSLLDHFAEAYPRVPFAHFTGEEPAPFTIGHARKVPADLTLNYMDTPGSSFITHDPT